MSVRLSRFAAGQRIIQEDGTPTPQFLRWLNDSVSALANQGNTNADLLAQINTALDNAGIATTNANAATANLNLINSYVSPINVLGCDGAGGTATITIAAHSRKYANNVSVAVNAGSVSGLAFNTVYYIVYLDPNRAGGTVAYTATTDQTLAGQTGSRHLVGTLKTPPYSGAGAIVGATTPPPGIPDRFDYQ